jgi:hypothetical protein
MKCVTSPNDFEIDSFVGIPDEYDGRTIAKRHTSVNNMATPVAGQDFYIVLAPVPGVAYYTGSRATGSTASLTLTPTYYSDTATIFPSTVEGTVVNAFRYASNVLEIVPTVNSMAWGGAIEVWKGVLTGGVFDVGAASTANYSINGFDALNSDRPQSVLPFNHGAYSVTTCCNAENMFTPILTNSPPAVIICPMKSGASVTLGGASNFTGIGCQETVIFKMPFSTASNTALIRTWACIEYQVTPTSILYDYSHVSPPADPRALALVRQFIHSNPAAVPYFDNDSFWKRFTSWVKTISGALRVVPGPVGDIAGIVNLTSKVAESYL